MWGRVPEVRGMMLLLVLGIDGGWRRAVALGVALTALAVVAACVQAPSAPPPANGSGSAAPSFEARSSTPPVREPRSRSDARGRESYGDAAAAWFVDEIRVRLVEWCGAQRLRVTVPTDQVRATAGDRGQPLELPLRAGTYEVRADESGRAIHFGRYTVRTNTLCLELPGTRRGPSGEVSASEMFALATDDERDATPVRGSLTLRVTRGGHLEPIITLDMRSYVAGSLLAEMPASFGEAALRAQAVAIRTFTTYRVLATRAGNNERPYDVQSSVADLRYGGTPYERPISWRVAEETAGEVLTYDGKLFPTFFHSTSGGTTISSASYFGDFAGFPPLAGGVASPSEASPLHQWVTTLDWREVRENLLREGFDERELGATLHEVRRLFPSSLRGNVPARGEADPARRPHSFALVTDAGTVRIRAPRLRALVGGGRDAMPSTCFTVVVSDNTLTLHGHGFGHGVGLCQYGAGALGKDGATHPQILSHFYPQSRLMRLEQGAQ